MGKFDNLKKVKDSAAMSEQKNVNKNEKKKKLINLSVLHEKLIKESDYVGSVSNYIERAIQNQLKNDGWL
jgi:hypothetical protein